MAAPLVSVIVPAHNAGSWLGHALDSILAQTLTGLEAIVVDDGSLDDTGAVISSYCRRDTRVSGLSRSRAGVSAARNAGAAVARGKFVTFLDADDLWAPDKIERQLVEARSGTTAVLCALRRFTQDGDDVAWLSTTVPPEGRRGAAYLRTLLFLHGSEMAGFCGCLAPLDAWRSTGGYDTSLSVAEDWDLWLRLARRVDFVTLSGEPLYFYRKRSGSVTKTTDVRTVLRAWRSILAKQASLGDVTAGDVRRARSAKALDCADMFRVKRDVLPAAAALLSSVVHPGVLFDRRFHVTLLRLLRGG
jgi:glycosyltransferase involved in cell wall biosynthesis